MGAVIPAVIPSFSVAVIWAAKDRENVSLKAVSILVILFSVSFYLGSDYSLDRRAEAAIAAKEESARLAAEYRLRHLEWCSEVELLVNSKRKYLKLPPLESEVFCGG